MRLLPPTALLPILLACARGAVAEPADHPTDPIRDSFVQQSQPAEALDRSIGHLASLGFSGVVFVAKDGLVVLHKAYGLADRSERVPIATRSAFPIGSMTRIFAAAAILRLQMEGKVDTRDPVSKYDPDFHAPPGNEKTTVHDLLAGTGAGNKAEGVEPLSELIEKASGQSFEDCLAQTVFGPARMRGTWFTDHRPVHTVPVPHGYAPPDPTLRRAVRIPGFRAILPLIAGRLRAHAAGLTNAGLGAVGDIRVEQQIFTTAGDLFLWSQALMSDTFFSPDARTQIFNPIDNTVSYGWKLSRTDRGTTRLAATGDLPGYESGMWIYPSDNLVVIVLANNDMGWREAVRAAVESSVLGRSYTILYALGGLVLLFLLLQGAMRRRVPYRKGRHPRIYP
jgi:CubicO group peptidase (beta-lactamase class C family)